MDDDETFTYENMIVQLDIILPIPYHRIVGVVLPRVGSSFPDHWLNGRVVVPNRGSDAWRRHCGVLPIITYCGKHINQQTFRW